MSEFVLVLVGGVGGAIVSWMGSMITGAINHNREVRRMTYLHRLEVCEKAMAVICGMRDQLAQIILYAKRDENSKNEHEVAKRCDELSRYIDSAMSEVYKLYLYFDLESIEKKYKLDELMPMYMNACVEMQQISQGLEQQSLSEKEWDDLGTQIKQFSRARIEAMELTDAYFAEVAEILRGSVTDFSDK